MSVHEILTRLKALSETNRALAPRITLLAKPDSIDDEPQARAELSTEIHQELKELEEDFELVKQEAEDITTSGSWKSGARRGNEERDRERVSIAGQIERLGEDLKLSRSQFRKAQLQAKRNAEAAQRKEREQLFAGVQDSEARSAIKRRGQEKLSEDDILLNASNDVTAALRRTHQLMTSELSRSQFAHETLQRSTAALQSLNESYSNIDTLLSSSKSLISTLVSSSKSDTWYLETAFWILVYTLVWLLFRRIFYGPIRYLAYLPTKWMIKIFLSLFQIFAGAFAASGSGNIDSSIQEPQASLAVAEIPLGKREGRHNPALPKHQIPNDMAEPNAKTGGPGQELSEKLENLVKKKGTETQDQKETSTEQQEPDPEAEAEPDDQWTAPDDEDDDNEEHGTVLRDPEPGETPNPKKRMWEEPVEGEQQRHDEL